MRKSDQSVSAPSSKPSWLLRILIPVLLVLIWLAVGGVGGPKMGQISDVATNDRALFLPEGAESTEVNTRLEEFQDDAAPPAVIVIDGVTDPGALKDLPDQLAAASPQGTEFSPVIPSEDGEAVQLVALLPPDVDAGDAVAELRTTLETAVPEGATAYVTGPAGISADLSEAFGGIDGLLLGVALIAVFVILVIVYRSPILPILVLLSAMLALVGAAAINVELARQGFVQINGQIQGILFILVIGAATDYGLLYTARYREELARFPSAASATWAAIKGVFEPILASGATVIAGLLCLLLSDLGSNAGLGPVASIGIAMAMLASLTFLPASLALLGRVAFWPKAPREVASATDAAHAPTHRATDTASANRGIWARVSKLVQHRPKTVALAVTVLLALGCVGLTSLDASGVPQSEFVLGESQARDGQKVLDEHFAGGSGSPAYVVTSQDHVEDLGKALQGIDGVESIAVASKDSPSGSISFDAESGTLSKEGPFAEAKPTVSDGDVLMEVTLAYAADSLEAEHTIVQMREEAHKVDALVGGTTAIDLDTNTTSERDREVIIPVILLAITVMLALLLRSVVAPIVLLLTTVLSFGTALGVSAWIFDLLGFSGSDPTVPLYGFVFLVALGIDYNIFLMTRVREETALHGIREGVHRGLTSTGGVITSAGVVLAATFAALFVIPIQFLVQLAIIVSFGVLLDALVVRSLLVPALSVIIGRWMWWPSALVSQNKPRRKA